MDNTTTSPNNHTADSGDNSDNGIMQVADEGQTEQAPFVTKSTRKFAFVILLMPALIPLILAFTADSWQSALFLVLVSIAIIMMNLLFFRLIYRWIQKVSRET